MSPDLYTAAERLRASVGSGDYQTAEKLTAIYCRMAQEEMRRLGAADPQAIAIQAATLDLLEWARRVTLAARSCCADRLRTLSSHLTYREPRALPHGWEWHA